MSSSRILASFSVLGLSFFLFNLFSGSTSVTVETNTTIYKGTASKDSSVTIFYGIPYAKPPLGNLRFRAPVSLPKKLEDGAKKKIIRTQKVPDFCVQYTTTRGEMGGAGSEDCLHLNIYTPKAAVNGGGSVEKLPVLVEIHGGGFVSGNPASWPYEHWIEQSPNTVIVSIYYRLNIFGFFAAPGGREISGLDYNVGFQDQLAALNWVKENIGAFGGDSARITIKGQSAGGASVQLHLVANGGKQDIFHQAIAQSIYRPAMMRIPESRQLFDFIAGHTGCDSESYSESDQVDCLRGKEVSALMRASEAASRYNVSWRFLPVVDGAIFKDTSGTLVDKGQVSPVVVLSGATTDETFAWSDDWTEQIRTIYPTATYKNINSIQKLYPIGKKGFSSKKDAVAAAVGELVVRCGAETLVETMARVGVPSYIYRFDQPNPTQNTSLVHHSAENWWMHQGSNTGNNGTFTLTPFTDPSQERFARELIAYWISFVHYGDPNVLALDGSPRWVPWKKGVKARDRLILKQGEATSSGSSLESESASQIDRCRALSNLAGSLGF